MTTEIEINLRNPPPHCPSPPKEFDKDISRVGAL
jgi:hypothetical protein